MRAIYWYVLRVTEVEARELQETFERILERPEDQVMGTLDRLLRERHERGLAEGQAKGLAEGQAKAEAHLATALRKLLTRRFGELPEAVVARIEHGDLEHLERWTERVLDVGSPGELFAD